MLTFTATTPCTLCGYRLKGFYILPARVNKASIRTTGEGIGATSRWCPECGTPNAVIHASTYRLDLKSRADVDAYRARKWGGGS